MHKLKYGIICGIVAINALLGAAPPNIVFILADDLGSSDLGCTGHPYARTPALDQLAAEGTRFEQFYVSGITCCPSRTGFMTARHPARFADYPAGHGFGNQATITELLKKNGYRTGHFGKWHIGPPDSETNGVYGIDIVDVIKSNHTDPEGRDTDLFEAAIKFIEAATNTPFYINIWGHISHYPVDPLPALAEPFKDLKVKREDFGHHMQSKFDQCEKLGGDIEVSMRNYLGEVLSLDQQVGKLLLALDRLGLTENTLVLFSSDHGPAPVKLKSEKKNKKFADSNSGVNPSQNMLGYAGGLRGGKHDQYEGGVRSPFIIRWPGRIPAGKVNNSSIISGLDWLPSLCALAGISIDAAELDGEDVSDIWLGADRSRKKPLFWRTSAPNARPSIRSGNWKLHQKRRGGTELYNLSNDPEERQNIATRHPEVVERLEQQLDLWLNELPGEYDKTKAKKKRRKKNKRR